MNISIFQIILGLIAAMFIINGVAKFMQRENGQTFFKFFVTIAIWGCIFILSIFPKISHTISEQIGFGENLNTLIFIGFVTIFVIIFKIINIMERTERNISEIVRKEALSKIKQE